jgi:hypothetical protein
VAEDLIGYDQLAQDALRTVVRSALQVAAGPRGLPGKHHFYITFRTHAPGVVIPEALMARYPEEMTIVLEHQYWDLEVFSDRFRVILKFAGQPQPLAVPFAAISRFYDPSTRFGLQFDQPGDETRLAASGDGGQGAPTPSAPDPTDDGGDGAGNGAVISFDKFRRK